MSAAKPPMWIVFKAHLRADARKTVALVVLFVVMIVVYARMFSTSGPSEADAGIAVAAAGPGAATAATPTVAVAGAPIASMDRVVLTQPFARDIKGDPFAIELDRYPLGHAVKADAAQKVEVAENADVAIRDEAKSLTLQSTVCGATRIACISGQCLRQGELIDGFVLERVEPNRVVLQREGVRVALFLK